MVLAIRNTTAYCC
uniref:Uncharacterized protein n=1 Tax=Anguilla anguilla TaxID=7936 RepID=A0A0E9UR79_ANGAN